MQFTNRRGNGTYALVVRRCPGAKLDPKFESGATNLLNAMKAAICLLDLELAGMRADIREAYRKNPSCSESFRSPLTTADRETSPSSTACSQDEVELDELSRPQEHPPSR